MENAKHTPGPWTLAASAEVVAIAGRTVTVICSVRQQGEDFEWQPNARLIAAAPDLAEALQRAVDHADSHDDYDWIGAARAALRKAGITD
jgi:hypothetical protein